MLTNVERDVRDKHKNTKERLSNYDVLIIGEEFATFIMYLVYGWGKRKGGVKCARVVGPESIS